MTAIHDLEESLARKKSEVDRMHIEIDRLGRQVTMLLALIHRYERDGVVPLGGDLPSE